MARIEPTAILKHLRGHDRPAAARRVNKDVLILVHGGPVAHPEDAEYILSNAKLCQGFYGAYSMERLPTEVALTGQTKTFMAIKRRRDDAE